MTRRWKAAIRMSLQDNQSVDVQWSCVRKDAKVCTLVLVEVRLVDQRMHQRQFIAKRVIWVEVVCIDHGYV